MESMKHFASTKYNVSVITISFFFQQIYCITVCYIGTTLEQQQSILHIYIIILLFVCAMNICRDQCGTVFDKIYIRSVLFSQDKENVTHKVTAREKGLGVIAISSQHCLREASTELVKRLSCLPFLISGRS